MKDRLTTLALAAGALALFYVFFVPKPTPESQEAELPLSTQAGPAGYQGLWRWLQGAQVPVISLREPYSWLTGAASGVAPAGNVLITTLPHRVPARNQELRELDAWIARGNTLVVMAALDDTPRWALGPDQGLMRSLNRMTRLRFEAIDEEDAPQSGPASRGRVSSAVRALIEAQRFIITPTGAHPLTDGVRSLLVISDFPAAHWRAVAMDDEPVLALGVRSVAAASGPDRREPAIWLKRAQKGQILVFGAASAFGNAALAEPDNARLMSNIIAWSLGAGGRVIFDDGHQGAVSYYDARAFFADPRLHRTLWWILLLWLLFVLGTQRLRPAADRWVRPGITNFIAVTGRFFASSLDPAAAGAQLIQNFFDLIRRNRRLRDDGAAPWDWLAADARIPAARLAELKRLDERIRAGKAVDLIRLHNLLSDLKEAVA